MPIWSKWWRRKWKKGQGLSWPVTGGTRVKWVQIRELSPYRLLPGLSILDHSGTIHLRRLWTSAFFWLASGTVGFSPQLKNSGHLITFLRRCGLQNTDHMISFWPLKVDSLSHVFPAFVKVQRKERCPLYKILSTLTSVYAQWTTPRTCIDYQLECMLLPLQFKL